MVLEERPHIQKVSIDYKLYQNSKKIETQVQQKQTNKQSQKQAPSRQEQVKKKKDNTSNKNRKANEDKINLQFEYKPGMVITDDLVNQMSPEQIYELFTQLDLDNQVGLESKIFNLDMKRVQINATDTCTICMEDIQPQKEAADIRLDCNHQFHYDCIKQWLLKSKFCPVCKEDVDLTNYQYLE
ncbi:unnamed protein product [Paramecium pentaurelia]|uniref:RING-type E3 ubiquitin transferase n=1 Tax=Paramecium pentaurelia TaxID=43138 RepID=A0A8S1TC68_9CILI|nr:unnamed protein product [Paramecium pentaurelia]